MFSYLNKALRKLLRKDILELCKNKDKWKICREILFQGKTDIVYIKQMFTNIQI